MTKPEALAQLRQARDRVITADHAVFNGAEITITRLERWAAWHEAVRNLWEAV